MGTTSKSTNLIAVIVVMDVQNLGTIIYYIRVHGDIFKQTGYKYATNMLIGLHTNKHAKKEKTKACAPKLVPLKRRIVVSRSQGHTVTQVPSLVFVVSVERSVHRLYVYVFWC